MCAHVLLLEFQPCGFEVGLDESEIPSLVCPQASDTLVTSHISIEGKLLIVFARCFVCSPSALGPPLHCPLGRVCLWPQALLQQQPVPQVVSLVGEGVFAVTPPSSTGTVSGAVVSVVLRHMVILHQKGILGPCPGLG